MTKDKKLLKDIIPIKAKGIYAVASGKGGVGKSTVTVNLALALAKKGLKVGLLDADIYGPNIPLMLGIDKLNPTIKDNKLVPLEKFGLKVMSVGVLTPPEKALIWRGPLANKMIEQLLKDVDWGELDVFLIDLPPGTGDVPLSIIQKLDLTAGIIVTTPQEASVADVKKMINMFTTTNIRILGLVENMKYLVCGSCNERIELYPNPNGKNLSKILGYEKLAELPFEPKIGRKDKKGTPYYLLYNGAIIDEYDKLAETIIQVNKGK